MNTSFLNEAFKQLDLLEEQDFEVTDDGISSLGSFMGSMDFADEETIIDPTAESEEDLADSYVGKVILDCCVCHSKQYKDAAEVVIDDAAAVANNGEECPYCYSTDGFKVIGEVAPYSATTTEVNTDDDVKVAVDGEEEEPAELEESFDKVEIEADGQKIEINSVPVNQPAEQVIAPLEDTTKSQFSDVEDAQAEAEEEGTIDYDFDDFDEGTFNDLGESYLKEAYTNVKAFRTTCVKTSGNTLTVEGVIKFDSGKDKRTSFIFEAKDANRKGTVRFIGENCQICKGKKAFTLAGNVANGKFIGESFNYNYRAKNPSGDSVRMYGTVRTSK